MTEILFLFTAAVLAAIPAFTWFALLAEGLQMPWLGCIGAGLIFWFIMYYMISGRKLQKEQHDKR